MPGGLRWSKPVSCDGHALISETVLAGRGGFSGELYNS